MNILKTSCKRLKAFFLSPMFGRFIAIGLINGLNGIAFSYIFSIILPVNISFISKKRLRRVSFNFSSRVLGLDKIEYAKSNKVIRDKLMELQKIMDRGDF